MTASCSTWSATSRAYADTNVSVETPYEYTVRAVDAEQNRSGASNTAQVTVPDSESPTTPGNLTAQAAGAAGVDLSWTASTDNVGVTNYEIYRSGTLLATVGNVTSYTDTTVSVETPYQYTVRALDARAEPLRREQHRDGDGA